MSTIRIAVLHLFVAACASAAPVISLTENGFCLPAELPRNNCSHYVNYSVGSNKKAVTDIRLEVSADLYPAPIPGQQFVEYDSEWNVLLEVTLWSVGPPVERALSMLVDQYAEFGPNFSGDTTVSANGVTLFCPGGCRNRIFNALTIGGQPFKLRIFARAAAFAIVPPESGSPSSGYARTSISNITADGGPVYIEEVPEPASLALLSLGALALRLLHLKLLPSRRTFHSS